VEKPAAGTLAGAVHVLSGVGARHSVDVAFHLAGRDVVPRLAGQKH